MAKEIISLQEYQESPPLHMGASDRNICHRLARRRVWRMVPAGDDVIVTAGHHIGSTEFSDFIIRVVPKSTDKAAGHISNVLQLVGYACRIDSMIFGGRTEFPTSSCDNLRDALLSLFTRECSNLVRSNFMRTHVRSQHNDLGFLRGKIMIGAQIKHMAQNRPRFACAFNELTYNNTENQILYRCALIGHALTRSSGLRKALGALLHMFAGRVDAVAVTKYDFQKIHYSTHNRHYKGIHELCRLIIESSGLDDCGRGTHSGDSFFVDMNKVFERFVIRLLEDYYPQPSRVLSQRPRPALDSTSNYTVSIIPDIHLTGAQGERIIDVKYKKIQHSDLYQISFYMRVFGLTTGFLIAPSSMEDSDTKQSKDLGIVIHTRAIDTEHILALRNAGREDELKEGIGALLDPAVSNLDKSAQIF